MATKQTGAKSKAKKTASRRAARSKAADYSNGMKTYALHAYDEGSADVVSKLKAETEATPSFSMLPADTAGGGTKAVDPETAARGYLSQALASKSVPSLVAPQGETTDFKVINTESVPLTNTVMVKFRQRFSEVPVYGSLVSVELDDQNELVSMNTSLGEPVDISPVAKKSPADAMKAIKDFAGHKKDLTGIVPKLNYYFDTESQKWHLAYIAEDVPVTGGGSVRSVSPFVSMMDYVVDAHTGKVLAELTRSAHVSSDEAELDGLGKQRKFRADQNGTKKELFDSTLNIRTFDFKFQDIDRDGRQLPGKAFGNPPKWTPAAVSAHANAAVVAEYLRNVLGRKNIDNNNGPIRSSVNCDLRRGNSRPAPEWINAQWNGQQMLYGQRKDGTSFISLAIALDVVGHEMFHGVTQFTSRLVYETQSGALNESYSDIFGVAIKNSMEPDVSKWDWTIGKGLLEGGAPFRDLQNPERFRQPAHMRNFVTLAPDQPHDFGGVHTNSGIHNKAAFLIFTAKDRDGNQIFTPAQTAGIFYLTLTQQLAARSQFADARRGSVLSTQSLFRTLPADRLKAATDAVENAFEAVGIQ